MIGKYSPLHQTQVLLFGTFHSSFSEIFSTLSWLHLWVWNLRIWRVDGTYVHMFTCFIYSTIISEHRHNLFYCLCSSALCRYCAFFTNWRWLTLFYIYICKFKWLALLWYALYGGGLERNLQYSEVCLYNSSLWVHLIHSGFLELLWIIDLFISWLSMRTFNLNHSQNKV